MTGLRRVSKENNERWHLLRGKAKGDGNAAAAGECTPVSPLSYV